MVDAKEFHLICECRNMPIPVADTLKVGHGQRNSKMLRCQKAQKSFSRQPKHWKLSKKMPNRWKHQANHCQYHLRLPTILNHQHSRKPVSIIVSRNVSACPTWSFTNWQFYFQICHCVTSKFAIWDANGTPATCICKYKINTFQNYAHVKLF